MFERLDGSVATTNRPRWRDCLIAAAVAGGAVFLQWVLWAHIQPSPFLLMTAAVLVAGWRGGLWPGLTALAITVVGVDVLFLGEQGSLALAPRDLLRMTLFILVGLLMTALNVARLEALRSLREQHHWFRTTLASIGDAVIATDEKGRVTFLNGVAAALTEWKPEEALGRPLDEVFQIVDERTRLPVENPVERVIRDGRVVGLANHTMLISRSGEELVIEDSGAPIRDARGNLVGVVMVFRDSTPRWREQQRKLILGEASSFLASSLDYNVTLGRVADLAVPKFADWCAVHLVEEDQTVRMVAIAHKDPNKVHLPREIAEELEAQGYLKKPTGFHELLETMNRFRSNGAGG